MGDCRRLWETVGDNNIYIESLYIEHIRKYYIGALQHQVATHITFRGMKLPPSKD